MKWIAIAQMKGVAPAVCHWLQPFKLPSVLVLLSEELVCQHTKPGWFLHITKGQRAAVVF